MSDRNSFSSIIIISFIGSFWFTNHVNRDVSVISLPEHSSNFEISLNINITTYEGHTLSASHYQRLIIKLL